MIGIEELCGRATAELDRIRPYIHQRPTRDRLVLPKGATEHVCGLVEDDSKINRGF